MTSPFSSRPLARCVCAALAAVAFVAFAVRSIAADLSARFEEIVQRHVAANEFTGAVLVAQRGAVLFDRAYGLANREWDIPNTPITHFRIGSITKQFTAVSILLLEQRGKLKTTDLVSAHLPDAPAAWSAITLHHLLTHTSGIPNVTSDPEFILWKNSPATVLQMVGRFRDQPLDFPAGERHAYSNSNYLVLGLILEKLSGQRYGDFLREHMLDPLGLKDSGLDANQRILPRRASGYVRRGDEVFNAPYSDMSVPHAAGAMYSTTHDLWRWAEAVLGGDQLLTPASRTKLLTPEKDDYALGVRVTVSHGRKLIEHGGSIAGFSSALGHYPDERLTVVVLSNQNTRITARLVLELAAVALEEGKPARVAMDRPVPAAVLASYAGVYELRPGLRNTIRFADGVLTTQLTGQRAARLIAESDTKFFLAEVDAQVEFVRDASGRTTGIVMHQNGRSRQVPRVEDK